MSYLQSSLTLEPDGVSAESVFVRTPFRGVLITIFFFALSLIIRLMHLSASSVSAYDPWRHMALIRNIREGLGFTLFDGQPYIWYNPVWYFIAALFAPENVLWFAGIVSSLIPPLLFWLSLRLTSSFWVSVSVGLMAAMFGPLVGFTCTMGGEAFAMVCLLSGVLACTWRNSRKAVLIGGALFGLALATRINLVYNGFLVLPLLGFRKGRFFLFGLSVATVVGAFWLRNIWVIQQYNFLFTWDGLASDREGYGLLSSLIPQLHPDIQHATRDLYLEVKPSLGWIRDQHGVRWGAIAFMSVGVLATLFLRNLWLLLVVGFTMIHFSFLDSSLITNFFRHYIAVFPAMFLAISMSVVTACESILSSKKASGIVSILASLLVLLSGYRYLRPHNIMTLGFWTLSEQALGDSDHILVNSGMYQPESFAYRYPDRSFVGLPFRPERMEDFLRSYPEYRTLLWRDFYSVQDSVLLSLIDRGRLEQELAVEAALGIRYYRFKVVDPLE